MKRNGKFEMHRSVLQGTSFSAYNTHLKTKYLYGKLNERKKQADILNHCNKYKIKTGVVYNGKSNKKRTSFGRFASFVTVFQCGYIKNLKSNQHTFGFKSDSLRAYLTTYVSYLTAFKGDN